MPEKIVAPTARTTLYNGVHGNACTAALKATLAAAAAGTTVVLGEFDTHPTVTDFRIDHGALGAGVTLDVGFNYSDDTADAPDALADGVDAESAGSVRMSKAPVVADNKFCQLVAVVKGGTANGELAITVNYTNRG